MSKGYKFKVHFHKARADAGEEPWTVHVQGMCIPAVEVQILVPAKSVYKPHLPTNPRGWIEGYGLVKYDTRTQVVRIEAPK